MNPYYPDPYYAYSPIYAPCQKVLTPVAKALDTPDAILPLKLTPMGLEAKVAITGSIQMMDGCSVSKRVY
jgi:hypothetical protein